jgi:hypothetical protein
MPFVPPADDNSENPDQQSRDRRSRPTLAPTPPSEAAPQIADDLRSFIFEVTAGRPTGVADATEVPDFAAVASTTRPARRPAARRKSAVDGRGEAKPKLTEDPPPQRADLPAANLEVASLNAERSGRARATANRAEARHVRTAAPRQRPAPRRSRLSALPICTASLSLHALVIVVLAAIGIAAAELPDELLLTVGPPPVEEFLLSETDFETPEPTDQFDTAADEIPSELIDPGMASLGELATTAALADPSATGEPTVAAGALGGDLGALFGQSGAGLAEFDDGLGGAPTAKFFGSEIEGRRIVFVLDNSGSMQGGRLETVIDELLRCVDSLRDDQEFYVIFHSDMVYPLLYPDPVDRYLRPTKANKRLLAEWLDTVELCLGDAVEEALAAAAMIEPDTVFLLSDGRIQGDKKIRYLLDARTRNFPVHTFAVGMNSSVAGRRNLQQIADANGGNFTESEIPPEMRDLSRERLRPYHNETPGPVWGRNVKPFKKF